MNEEILNEEILNENQNDVIKEIIVIRVVKTYSEAQKRAIKKYRTANKDKVNAMSRINYHKRKHNDENFLANRNERARDYYWKRKEQLEN